MAFTNPANPSAAGPQAGEPQDALLRIGSDVFRSRLLVGTGKYPDFECMRACHQLSGSECVTLALRRVNLDRAKGPSILDFLDTGRLALLPNTAGCFDAATAIRTAHLARELLGTKRIKLEVLGDERTLLPDPVGTLEATRELVAQGFEVWVYTSDDPRLGVRLAELGATCVMPAGSPIGSGAGVLNPSAIQILLELLPHTPIVLDAGVGTASDVAQAMELGVDAVLLNSGIALAREPQRMAAAMRDACRAGRNAFLAGRIPRKLYGSASSPVEGRIARSGP